MDYFRRLQDLLRQEKEEDRRTYEQLTATLSITDRRENGMSWYPIAIKDTELGRGDYLTVEVERTTHQDIIHQFRFGMTVALFSNHDAGNDRIEGTITHLAGNKMKITLRTDELPDWSRRGKLGIDVVFDENSYAEMESALKLAPLLAEKKDEGHLVKILTGEKQPGFNQHKIQHRHHSLNRVQESAVEKILSANELAIVHGPPGTGKTTTLVQAIKMLIEKERQQILVTAPSNAAVDLLTEKLSDAGLNVVRVGNPARVNEQQMSLTLDSRISAHNSSKEINRLRKQATAYRDMAHKYKRSFGAAEREQRKALFTEARNIRNEIEKTEQYIIEDVLSKANVITSTLVGANHYTIRNLKFHTTIIDEAGQAIEPACWIPILKSKKLVMAGDHCQLPPTIRSAEAAKELGNTLMEKLVRLHPSSVVLLEEQYRMNEQIMGFSSNEFYNGKLKAHASLASHVLFEEDQPLIFIDTAGCGYDELKEASKLSNPEEALFLLTQLNKLVEHLQHIYAMDQFPSIGIISPYRHQVELLKDRVHEFPLLQTFLPKITINTIDSFQGQERDIIFISLVRSNVDAAIGFLSEIRRMNVAMTRARKKLVMTGDSATLSQFSFYADLIGYSEKQNGYITAWELMG